MMNNSNYMKTIVNVPGWIEEFGNNSGKLNGGVQAYAYVPLVYRCVRLIADSLASVDLHVYKGKGNDRKEVDWPFEVDPVEWTWKTAASILLTGASYSVKLTNRYGNKLLGLQWLNPTTISPQIETSTGKVRFTRTGGTMVGGNTNSWDQEQMLYIREFNLVDDVLPGQSATGVALTDAGLIRYLTRFASYYFEQGAMPLTIIPIPQSTSSDEVQRVEGKFRSLSSGIKKAWSVMAMRTGKDSGTPFTLTPPLKDLVMVELQGQARRAVAAAFGIPQTMLEDSANYATASEHTKQFWTTCVRPRGRQITSILNQDLFKSMGLECEYAFEELDVFQEDEANRADSVVKLVQAGSPLLVAMDILGYTLTGDQRGLIDSEMERRHRVQESGVQAASGKNPSSQSGASSGPANGAGSGTVSLSDEENQPSIRDALFMWKRAALVSMQKRHLVDVDFDNPVIPEAAADRICAGLKTCRDVDAVHEVFKKAREWVKEESPYPLIRYAEGGQHNPIRQSQEQDGLVAELKRANDLLEAEKNIAFSSMKATIDMPQINITIPEIRVPGVTVNVPKPEPVIVNVTNEVKPAEVMVQNIPAPVVEVKNAITVQPANIVMPELPQEATITTDPRTGKRTMKVTK